LRDLGYEEGKTVTFEWRWWNDQVERLPELAAELVSLDVQAIVTAGTPAAKALKNATRSIPIIMAVIGDPVAAGLVDSLAHPGGNVTGFSILASDLSGKRLELLKEVVLGLSSLGVILNPENPQPKIELKQMEAAARTLGVQIRPIQISAESSLQSSFESISRNRSVQAVIVLTDALLYNHRKQIATLAAAHRLPAMYFFREFVAEGGLMRYGPNDIDLFRRTPNHLGDNGEIIHPASRTSSCFMLMICSSRARNRSPDPVVSCFFGRITPSDAATESRLADSRKSSKRNCKLSGAQILKPCNLKPISDPKSDSRSRAYKLFTGD